MDVDWVIVSVFGLLIVWIVNCGSCFVVLFGMKIRLAWSMLESKALPMSLLIKEILLHRIALNKQGLLMFLLFQVPYLSKDMWIGYLVVG